MIFTVPELAALNSISGGGVLPGMRLAVPTFDSHAKLWASVHDSLKEKNIVGPSGHLTKFGVIPVRVVELYRTAAKHAFLGRARVSCDSDGSVTMLTPVGDDWEVIRAPKEALMVGLLNKFPFLCGKSNWDDHPGSWESMSYEAWVGTMMEFGPENLLVANGVNKGESPTDLMAYGLSRGRGYEYNMSRARGRQRSVRDIRTTIAGMIGIEGSANYGV